MTAMVNRQVDLRFQEQAINNGGMAIARGFQVIYEQELWKAHPNNYDSFAAYCNGEWVNKFSYDWIYRQVSASAVCDTIEATVTSRTEGQNVTPLPMPTKVSQARALKAAPGGAEGLADVWEKAVEQAGGEPNNATVAVIQDQIAKAVQQGQEGFPIGSPVLVMSHIKAMTYNGYTGHVIRYDGNSSAVVRFTMDDGTAEDVTIPFMWLNLSDGPLLEIEAPPPKLKKLSRLEQALELLQRLVDEGGLPTDLKAEVEKFLRV